VSSSGRGRRAIRRAGGVDRLGGRSAEVAEGRSAERVKKALRHLHPDQLVLDPDRDFAPSSMLPIQLDEPYSKRRALGLAADRLRQRYG